MEHAGSWLQVKQQPQPSKATYIDVNCSNFVRSHLCCIIMGGDKYNPPRSWAEITQEVEYDHTRYPSS